MQSINNIMGSCGIKPKDGSGGVAGGNNGNDDNKNEKEERRPTGYGSKGVKMGNVFATPLEFLGMKEGQYVIPVHPKSPTENDFIRSVVIKNFIFEHLTRREINKLVDAFEKTIIEGNNIPIIKQGDVGDYFYVLYEGTVEFVVNDKAVGKAESGASFGELALMYTSPRAATVRTVTEQTTLYRVDQATFRFILQAQTKEAASEKIDLLKMVSFLTDLNAIQLTKLAAVMTPKKFTKGDYLMKKGDAADFFYILADGIVVAKNVGVGDAKFEDLRIEKRGDYFGERALVTGEPRAADIIAETEVTAFAIDKDTFENVLGKLNDLILRAQDKRKLEGIKVIADSKLSDTTLVSLVSLLRDQKFHKGATICTEGIKTTPALYLVREGEVRIHKKHEEDKHVGLGGFFGDDQLLADVTTSTTSTTELRAGTPPSFLPTYTVTVSQDCTIAVLSLEACRTIVNTRFMGTQKADESAMHNELNKNIKLEDLRRHSILGQGTFGQVWLVSLKSSTDKKPYALKIQSKFELIRDGQANAVAYEKNIMLSLNHPFLLPLINTYQDSDFIYMLLGLVQGGELFTYIHRHNGDGVKEKDARFYAAGICEALAHMHKHKYVYRDLKAENVLIDAQGYTVIIDFGFAKKLTDKTYTLCGTPLYLPPEVILNRGHDFSADHWSIGVLVYEMVFGDTPFYQSGMQQMDLFRSIVKGKYIIPSINNCREPVSPELTNIIRGLLSKDPAQRLGSLKGGEDDILGHKWFSTPIPASGDDIIDFKELRLKKIKAPLVPKIKNPFDTSNFEDWSHIADKSRTKFPKLTKAQEKIFADF